MLGDPHKPLRDDVRLLGELLGETLRLQEGEAIFNTVERVRSLAKSAHNGRDEDFHTLADILSRLPVESALPVARAFSHFLNLANIAEQHHRTRRRRAYQHDPQAQPQRGSADETFGRLIAAGVSPDALYEAVCSLGIELVLTAHPTEILRRSLLLKYNRIAGLLARRDRPDLTAPEREELHQALRREVLSSWETDEVRHERPTPIDEVRWGLVVFEQTLWEALPRYLRSVDRALRQWTGRPLPLDATPIRFGSWMGGDRDGNPSVTPEVTREACLMARWMAVTLYEQEIEALRAELSMNRCSPELRERIGDAHEPYRTLLAEVRRRLAETRRWLGSLIAPEPGQERAAAAGGTANAPPEVYVDTGALLEPLQLCHRSLTATGNAAIADGRLSDLLRRLAAFGLTLARLDIRQDASRHTETLDALTRELGLGSYAEWDEETRIAFLERELAGRRPLVPLDFRASPEVEDVLATFRMLKRIHPDSLGAYIITMASRASDVLAVELLQKEAGIRHPLRVVPLFETAADLRGAGALLDRLFRVPWYRQRIGGHQEVMVGYSDSAKEIGRFSAAWELYKAQEVVLAACARHQIQVTLFHGRGGSVGRGGGPTYLALQSQPPGSINGRLRVTEQGEMIQAKFGQVDIAIRTMELYTSGSLEAMLAPAPPPPQAWRDRMEQLSLVASRGYRSVVYEHPHFVEYFYAATPARELEELNIGSRPARRRTAGDVGSLRAIPWQFAWTQTRLLLASWLGVEDALGAAISAGARQELREMARAWPFFNSTLGLMEMVLAKADARIAAQYDRQLVPAPLRPLGEQLRARLARAIECVLDITGHSELLEDNPVLRRSIDVRNPYVDPINLVQIELLRRLRAGGDDRLRRAFVVTVNGVAAGLRNTG